LPLEAIIFANIGGPLGSGKAGLSQVAVPFLGSIARLGSPAEGMLVVDIDFGILDTAEQTYKIRADLARADWHYGYSRVDNSGEEADSALDE
jgi:hypothetical protein